MGRPPELTGHLDLRAWHSDYGEAIIDLKTGAQVGTAWLQVGGYLLLTPEPTNYGGVLHVPRTRIDRDVKGTLELRPSEPLMGAWQPHRIRIAAIMAGALPTRSPGLHCARCAADCPVRSWGCGMSGYTPRSVAYYAGTDGQRDIGAAVDGWRVLRRQSGVRGQFQYVANARKSDRDRAGPAGGVD